MVCYNVWEYTQFLWIICLSGFLHTNIWATRFLLEQCIYVVGTEVEKGPNVWGTPFAWISEWLSDITQRKQFCFRFIVGCTFGWIAPFVWGGSRLGLMAMMLTPGCLLCSCPLYYRVSSGLSVRHIDTKYHVIHSNYSTSSQSIIFI